uniref:UDP-glycosyltransferase n=1 Tax=Polyphagotarsonemus latus TaxID=1204166 RepID=A0AAN0LM54_9ACAR
MSEKKKIAFYAFLSSGHINFCSAIASTLLNNYPDKIEVYFFTDSSWAEKIAKIDSRYKFEIYEYEKKEQKDFINNLVSRIEPLLLLPNIDKIKELFKSFKQNADYFYYIDEEVSKLIKKLKPDFLLCDMLSHLPAMAECKIPYSFIISTNPLVLDVEDLPLLGLEYGTDEKQKIKAARTELKEMRQNTIKNLEEIFTKRNVIYDYKYPLNVPRSDYLTFYTYPKELDYFDDEFRKEYKILQVDSPIVSSRLPKPFELPDQFAKLPGKIIYVSLGSLFSLYHVKLQKLIDALSELPYKYIVSKGPFGDKLKFPNDCFIGENFVDQLAVLQVVDMMIAHGGNNTFTECFYFGVPALIFPVMGDQINNAKRIEETGFGYQMDLMNYTVEELKDKIEKIFSDESLIKKIKKVGERIRKENSLEKAVKTFYESLKNI